MKRLFCLLMAAMLLLTACHKEEKPNTFPSDESAQTAPVSLPQSVPKLNNDVSIRCETGTPDCYSIEDQTIRFSGITEESLYIISGQWNGNIVIDVGDDQKFELEMQGFSLVSETQCPIMVLSGDKVTLTAKKDYENFLYDTRSAVESEEAGVYAGAIHAECDLTIGGKGSLTVISTNNNGIHTKDDLEVKNLCLTVSCLDNALKGNDSVTVSGGNVTLIARQGDGIKTSNSNVSEKGNQRGTVTLSGCNMSIYAACDGVDAAYDVIVEEDSTVLNIYTDKYSDYSETVNDTGADNEQAQYYIRFPGNYYHYAVQYYNSDTDYQWVEAAYHSTVSGGRENYCYYAFPILEQYAKIRYFAYTSDQIACQDTDYVFRTDYLTVNREYDTFAIYARGNSLSYNWENYTTQIQDGFGGGPGGMGRPGGMGGPGGMQSGNQNKLEYSAKGMKAANAIYIYAGSVNIQAYDDAMHANAEATLENGATPLGNVTVSGGTLTLYSSDDGIHADGTASISDGTVTVTQAYEGVEGKFVTISGGNVSIRSSDDGINATAASGEAITISGGVIYVYAGGDGLDANSSTSYSGIRFSGGRTVVITASGGNSAIDTERGYAYTGGYVLAVTPSGGMSGETTNVQNLTSVGKKQNMSLINGYYLQVEDGNDTIVTVKMPCGIQSIVVFLGDPSVTISSKETEKTELDEHGVFWNVP